MDDPSTHILRRLNDTWKVLFVDADVAMAAGMVMFCGFMANYIMTGMAAGFVTGYLGHKFKGDRHPAYLLHLKYWYFPPEMSPLRRTPPSYLREMVG